MAITPTQIIPAKTATVAAETQYTSALGSSAVIGNFTATNQSTTTTATISVHVGTGGALSSNRIIYEQQVLPRECVLIYQLTGKIIASGQSLITTTSAATLTISCDGSVS